MNDPMPPESLPPESSNLTTAAPTSLTRDAEGLRPTEGQRAVAGNRRQYDELIAVVVALFGIGAILFWVLGRGLPFNGGGPWGGAIAGKTSPNDATADLSKGRSGDAASSQANPQASPIKTTEPATAVKAADAQPSPETAAPRRAAADPAAATAGIAATAAAAGAAASGTPTVTATANNAPASPSASPEIVEPDVLPSATAARKFSDVTTASPIAPYVDALSSRGVLDQYTGTLNPDEPITRGEFANLVSKAFGKPRIKPEIGFSDMPADATSKAAVVEATRTGFMSGFPDKSFKPELKIPRYQMQVAIVTGTAFAPSGDPTQSLGKFADGSAVPKWATAKVGTAIDAGVLPAKNLTSLNPAQPATRGEAVVMLHEALVKEGKLPAVK
jgi:S-layer homology domain